MVLIDLINKLKKEDKNKIVPMGFCNPHSYRGYYDELAFEPQENAKIGDMLKCAKQALGKTYQGYKGGDYKMTEYTGCWIAEYGHCGETIGTILFDYMIGKY